MRSPINLTTINRSLTGLTESVKSAVKKSGDIADNVSANNKIKRDSISMSAKLFARRRDNQRRKEKEDLIEAGSVMGALRASGKIIQRTTKGFLGRIMDFVGTVIIGWAIINLPKIIKLAQDVIKRMQKYFKIISGFITNLAQFFTDFKTKLDEAGALLLKFDFEPLLNKIKGFMMKVQDSFNKITINTIKTVRKFSDKSQSELLKEMGIDEKFFNDLQKEGSSGDGSQEGTDSSDEGGEGGGEEDSNQFDADALIQQGIEALKEKRGGTLTKDDRRQLGLTGQNKTNKEKHKHLVTQDIILLQRADTGQYAYINLKEEKENILKLINSGVLLEVPFNRTPFDVEAGAFSDITPGDIMRERFNDFVGDFSDNFERFKDRVFDFKPPKKKNEIDVEIPVESNNSSSTFKENQLLDSDINRSVDNTRSRVFCKMNDC